ncbi:MAG TPA: glycosyltransferase family 4 protein [Deltaproteobacteria bacterium]|nr:glycosyltransferase family 4 protein [Deltaproteobacteria bacterium]
MLVVSSLSAGGAERVVAEIANWWSKKGRKVTVITLAGKEHDHYKLDPPVGRVALDIWGRTFIPWFVIGKGIKRYTKIRGHIRGLSPDIVVSFMDTNNVRTLIALAGTGVPVIACERTDPRHHDIGLYWSFMRRVTYPLCSALVVQTEAVAASWARRVVPARKVAVIPNFVRTMPETEETGPLHDEPVILTVGRLGREKGHDLLIRAFAALGEVRTGWRLVILGEGKERKNLERLASSLGIQDSVLMPGVVPEPAHWLYKAPIFVLPSRYEGFPNALLEAMAAGCAVIAADCPSGPAEIVKNDHNGILVPTEDVPALCAAMKRLILAKDLRDHLGRNAAHVSSTFSQHTIMQAWDSLVDHYLQRREYDAVSRQ